MRRRFIYHNGEAIEVGLDYTPEPRAEVHIIPDLEPWKDPSGAVITGRTHWREHLKRTDSLEVGHSDIQTQAQRRKMEWKTPESGRKEALKYALDMTKRGRTKSEVREVVERITRHNRGRNG